MLTVKHFARAVLATIISLGSLTACADMMGQTSDNHPKYDPGMSGGKFHDSNYLPYIIRFDKKGHIVVLDENGRLAKATRVKFPVTDVKGIESVQSLTSVIYKGSCVLMMGSGGVGMFAYPLPPSFCH